MAAGDREARYGGGPAGSVWGAAPQHGRIRAQGGRRPHGAIVPDPGGGGAARRRPVVAKVRREEGG